MMVMARGLGKVSRVVRLAAVIAAPAGLALGVMAPAGAQAQNAEVRTLNDQMVQVQRELNVLQKHVYQNGEVELAQAPQGNFADIQLRLGDLEERMRDMNGRMEELNHRISTLNDRLDKMSSDIDFRLNNAQQGGAAPGGGQGGGPGGGQGGGMPNNNSGAASPGGQPPTSLTQPAPGGAPALTPPPGANDPNRAPSQSGFLGTIPVNPGQQGTGQGGPGPQASAPPAQSAAPAPGKPLPDGSPEDQYNYALSLLRKSDYPGAEAALTAFVGMHPSHQLAGNAQYWLGETYYVRNDFNNAARAFAVGFQKYPKSQKGPDNLLKLGLSLGNLNKNKEACTSYSMLKSEFPKAPQEVTKRAEAEQKRLRC